jgi:hypothetical protein
MTTLSILAGVIAVAVIFVYAVRQPVLEGRVFPVLRPLFLLLFPPSDLYRPLVEIPIDLTDTTKVEAQFEHRYAGLYVVALAVEHRIDIGTRGYSFDGELVLEVSASDTFQFTRALGQELSPYWSASKNGFELTHYRVPEDLPRGKTLRATLDVRRPALEFHRRYGAARLIISKASEK